MTYGLDDDTQARGAAPARPFHRDRDRPSRRRQRDLLGLRQPGEGLPPPAIRRRCCRVVGLPVAARRAGDASPPTIRRAGTSSRRCRDQRSVSGLPNHGEPVQAGLSSQVAMMRSASGLRFPSAIDRAAPIKGARPPGSGRVIELAGVGAAGTSSRSRSRTRNARPATADARSRRPRRSRDPRDAPRASPNGRFASHSRRPTPTAGSTDSSLCRATTRLTTP